MYFLTEGLTVPRSAAVFNAFFLLAIARSPGLGHFIKNVFGVRCFRSVLSKQNTVMAHGLLRWTQLSPLLWRSNPSGFVLLFTGIDKTLGCTAERSFAATTAVPVALSSRGRLQSRQPGSLSF